MKIRIWGARGSIPSPLKPAEIEEKICQAILGMPDINTNDMEAVRTHVGELPDSGLDNLLPELEYSWGELYLITDLVKQALVHIQRAVEFAVEQGNLFEEGRARRGLGQVYLTEGSIN